MIRTQVQLTEEQIEKLKVLARKHKVSMSEIIRRSVDHTLGEQHDLSSDERRRRAAEAAGRFGSGHSDVSSRHDDHLAEAYAG